MAVTRPNQVWAMDITYIPMARGFVYLAVVLDWFSRRVLSWRLSITMEVQDEQGNPLDEYAGALAMPAGSGYYTGRIQSRHNEWAWVVNARRSCGD